MAAIAEKKGKCTAGTCRKEKREELSFRKSRAKRKKSADGVLR